jgi:hypothetical protein
MNQGQTMTVAFLENTGEYTRVIARLGGHTTLVLASVYGGSFPLVPRTHGSAFLTSKLICAD